MIKKALWILIRGSDLILLEAQDWMVNFGDIGPAAFAEWIGLYAATQRGDACEQNHDRVGEKVKTAVKGSL